jgi:hypothetical protein
LWASVGVAGSEGTLTVNRFNAIDASSSSDASLEVGVSGALGTDGTGGGDWCGGLVVLPDLSLGMVSEDRYEV